MKTILVAMTALATLLTSTMTFAHMGEHHEFTLFTGLLHLLSEHALPAAVIAVIVGGVVLGRLRRAG